ncbi:putative uncharacterized protein DDB_G0277255 [Aphidius gifuensis]|uniref:putative uncharacterized protein DDB_G0277255 n=1 Tax=Aphidius gifuensis TaxID=684658 RepID=UPI001CDCF20D|nr:putative uncharacterized protein DDB_G0277255 [Aphidius gifuensis]
MATGLVKWWRARFLAGYKPFSVVGGIAEGSDSEELLGAGVPSPCSSPSTPLPATLLVVTPDTIPAVTSQASTQNTQNDCEQQTSIPNATRQLNFEEFECDVSVAEGNRKRQEFSFTLYDFDGHGKITKDDIAGLVTTIYDTLGASIQVPPCGSKTIKVKLTVSPDKNTATASTMTPNHNATSPLPTAASLAAGTTTTSLNTSTKLSNNLPNNIGNNNTSSCCHNKNVNSCSHGNNSNRRIPRRRRIIRSRAEPRRLVESHSEDDADNVPPLPVSQTKQDELRKRVGPVPNLPSPYSNSSEGDVSDDSDLSPSITPSITPLTPLTPLVTKQRKRSGSMQRQQLLEIIQANMEKNNLSFHASRKRYQSEQQQRSPYSEPTSPYNIQKNYQQSSESTPRQQVTTTIYHKPIRDYSNKNTTNTKTKYRINLRKNRNQHNTTTTTTSTQRNSKLTPDKSLRNNLQSSSPVVTQNILNTEPNKQCNNNINNNNNNNNNTNNNNNINNNINNDIDYLNTLQSLNKTSKKHQLKHATREQDQARAMSQVVKWLETEFKQKESATSGASGRHHVHEHIHHHYHHYAEPAIV